jgi:hypothetical protein
MARYTDPSGRERAKSFIRKRDAERFLTGIENDKLRGTWTDPTLGRVQLADWWGCPVLTDRVGGSVRLRG